MNVYMATYAEFNKTGVGETWTKNETSNHTFFIFANDLDEANDYLKSALKKVNEYADSKTKYEYETEPRLITALSVTHNTHLGTSITGIWE